MSRFRFGIVNVRMVITEEKILSNIDKIKRMINPKNKKQIIQLEDDTYFKDLIESIKMYLIEYPKKKNFPPAVYRAAYDLVEYATNQFEENTKQIEELIRQRERNINSASELKYILSSVENKDKDWKEQVKTASANYSEDIAETLGVIARCKSKKSQNYQDSIKLINARITNLETNLHIEIDMERIEDRSKALSYIGIEVADALKLIPAPVEEIVETVEPIIENLEEQQYIEETRFEAKPTLWERIKRSKIARAITYIAKIRIRIDLPNALPEGRGENNF
ncbi:MAG: hypothetical protein IKT41_02615 [Clostridia bacterium]|nr:hypothetical protein [Clostridia bacterium]